MTKELALHFTLNRNRISDRHQLGIGDRHPSESVIGMPRNRQCCLFSCDGVDKKDNTKTRRHKDRKEIPFVYFESLLLCVVFSLAMV